MARGGADLAAVVEAQGLELAALGRRLAELEQLFAPKLSPVDRDRLSRVLPVIGGQVGSSAFKVCELFRHPSIDLRLVLAGCSAKSFGRLLARAVKAGAVVDGFVVESAGAEGGVALWAVGKVVS